MTPQELEYQAQLQGELATLRLQVAAYETKLNSAEPTYYEYRFWSGENTETPGWGEWERVKPRDALFTVNDAVDEIEHYIGAGYKYQLRELYEHPPAQSAVEWEPIETAPKDGVSRLYVCRGYVVQGFVDATGTLMVQSEIPPHWRKMRGKPTHWQPIHKPPVSAVRSE